MNLLTEFAQYWTTHLWSASLQVTIFISLVYLIGICCFRSFPARYRYVLWLLVIARLAVPTSITSPLGIGQYPEQFLAKGIQWASEQQYPTSPQLKIEQTSFPKTQSWTREGVRASLGNSTTPWPTGGMHDPVPLLCIIWLSGVLVLVFAIIARIWLFRRRTQMLRLVERPDLVATVHRLKEHLNIKRTVNLLEARDADNIRFPSVHGILRHTIIMPAGMAASWTLDALEPLLLHELTHIKRRDCLVNLVQMVLQVLYFYHPMVWFANWMIRREREFACDDDVVRHCSGCPTAYVRSMLQIAETAAKQRQHQLWGIAMADNFSNLGRRIRRMMNNRYRASQRSGPIYLGVILIVGLLCAAVSAQGPENPAANGHLRSAAEKYSGNERSEAVFGSSESRTEGSRPNELTQIDPSAGESVHFEIKQYAENENLLTDSQEDHAEQDSTESSKQRGRNEAGKLYRKLFEESKSDLKNPYQKWLNEDVVYIISEEEKVAFLSITTDEERDSFITEFWLRRDPMPGTLKNEFKEEHYSRITHANEYFVSDIPGWKTDRGRVYIMYGKPDRLESHPTGAYYAQPTWEGGGNTATFPFEKWWYRYIDGLGSDIEIEFVDSSMSGEYRMAMGPDEKIIQSDDDFFGPLIFDVRTDYIQRFPNKILVRITIEINNKELAYKKDLYSNRATVNVYGIVTSFTNRIMAEWEDEIISEFSDESFEMGINKRSVYQRMITLPPGERYKLDLVLKDVNGKKAGTRNLGLAVPKYGDVEP